MPLNGQTDNTSKNRIVRVKNGQGLIKNFPHFIHSRASSIQFSTFSLFRSISTLSSHVSCCLPALLVPKTIFYEESFSYSALLHFQYMSKGTGRILFYFLWFFRPSCNFLLFFFILMQTLTDTDRHGQTHTNTQKDTNRQALTDTDR